MAVKNIGYFLSARRPGRCRRVVWTLRQPFYHLTVHLFFYLLGFASSPFTSRVMIYLLVAERALFRYLRWRCDLGEVLAEGVYLGVPGGDVHEEEVVQRVCQLE